MLGHDLRALQIVDDPSQLPYPEQTAVIWGGLKILDYMILPHYKSDHPESAAIDEQLVFCTENKIPFRTLSDGEVLFGNNIEVLNGEVKLAP